MTRKVTICNTSNADEDIVVHVGQSVVVLRQGETHSMSFAGTTGVVLAAGETRSTVYLGDFDAQVIPIES